MATIPEKKSKTKGQQKKIYPDLVVPFAILVVCTGAILFMPLIICNLDVRWLIFIVISFVASFSTIAISIYFEKEAQVWILAVGFVLLIILCEQSGTYRKVKGYEKHGVIVDAEIVRVYKAATRYVTGYEMEYAFRYNGKEYSRIEIIDGYDYQRYSKGMTIPVIYNSRHPKVSRQVDSTSRNRFNLFLLVDRIFDKDDAT